MNKKLYVGNLSYSVRDEDLMEAFGRFGHVESAIVMSDRDSGRSKGFGFVEMSTEQEAQSAIEGLHDTDLAGRMLMVNIAKPREERPRSGGFNRGGGGGYNGGGGGYGGGDRGGYNGGGGGGYGGDRGGYR